MCEPSSRDDVARDIRGRTRQIVARFSHSRLADRVGGALGLRRRDVQVRAGPNLLRRRRVDQHAARLQRRHHSLGRAQLAIDAEKDQVCVHLGRVEAQPWRVGDRLGDDLGVAVVVGEALDVVFQRVQRPRRRHAALAHAAAEQFPDAPGLDDEVARPAQRRADRCA
jgi:hypothetical protein